MHDRSASYRKFIAPGLLAAGCLLLGASFALAHLDRGQMTWSVENSIAHSHASSEFHRLTFEVAKNPTPQAREKLLAAEQDFRKWEQRRVGAIRAAAALVGGLRWTGVAFVFVGLLAYLQNQTG